MNTRRACSPGDLTDQELLARVIQLAAAERRATAVLIAHLAELDARRLYLGEGYPSLFSYCTEALHLSEGAAYGRIQAARAGRKFPALLEMLAEGSLTLTTVGLLAPHLTAENHQRLLEQARHRSKREVEELIARLHPQPAAPTVIRRVPAAPVPTSQSGLQACAGEMREAPHPMPVSQATAPPPAQLAKVSPLAPQRYRVQFTASADTHEKLRRAQALLRHQVPNGDLDQILNRALTALLENLAREKLAATPRPRSGKLPSGASRHIPARVKRAVWLRDEGRCAFVGAGGRRCTERGFLEFHHKKPYAAGGEATVHNIELRCRAHNGYEADLYFGSRHPEAEASGARVREASAPYWVRTQLEHSDAGSRSGLLQSAAEGFA